MRRQPHGVLTDSRSKASAVWLVPLVAVGAGALAGNTAAVAFGVGLAGGLSLSGSV